MEALASFGGSDFGSLTVRKIDLKAQLEGEADKRKQEEAKEEMNDGDIEEPPMKKQKTR